MTLKPGIRVSKTDDRGIPTCERGTVLDSLDFQGMALIEWDDGDVRIESHNSLVPHHMLKAAVKHGQKLQKTSLRKGGRL